MFIALDYDRTFTEDPDMWTAFAAMAQARGHIVKIVTMRRPDETITDAPVEVIYTSRQAKAHVVKADVWIDDSPQWIFQDSI
tara:strand:+ start:103 stop:348 length:246 start_codon:yes stop_codon:yes gene_type:complete